MIQSKMCGRPWPAWRHGDPHSDPPSSMDVFMPSEDLTDLQVPDFTDEFDLASFYQRLTLLQITCYCIKVCMRTHL